MHQGRLTATTEVPTTPLLGGAIFSRRLITATTSITLALTLTGCTLLGGAMTNPDGQAIVPPDEYSPKTEEQTLQEALAHTDDLVKLLGGEWLDAGVPPAPFDPTTHAGWSYGPCGAPGTNRYSIYVQQVAPVADPLAKIEQVREHWKSRGYHIRQIGPADTDDEKLTEIFVDLPYGAGLGFNASTTGMGISTQSECVSEE
jgi:hypothetical protein